MRRILAAVVVAASALLTAPAHAVTCVGVDVPENGVGVCLFSDGWLAGEWIVCVYDAQNYPPVVVYVPGPGVTGQPCHA